jgi:ATP-binding cassette, subfamily B, multidrug efflux pump
MRKILIGISRKIEYSIRMDFFAHLQKLDPSFFINTRTGSIMALMTNDLEAVRNFLGPGLLNLFNTIFVFVTTLIVMFFINIKLSLYSLIAIPVLPILVSRLSALLYSAFRKSQEQYAALSARTQESIAGIKVIKSFAQEDNEKDVFHNLNLEYINRNLSLARIRSIFWPSMIFIGGIGTLVVLWIGGKQVITGTLTLGQFVQFSAYIGSITWPLISLGWVINLVQRGAVSMKRINNILKMEPLVTSPSGSTSAAPHPLKGSIRFENVSFRYESQDPESKISIDNFTDFIEKSNDVDERWVLDNISFNIEAGMQVGIVGFTGSGKSTMLNLIPRLADPQKGLVLIDCMDISKYPLDILRNSIGYAEQTPFLFSKTIKENIIFGSEHILEKLSLEEAEKRIIKASMLSHLHEDILQFPEGYETFIGERGVTLSGGQKQRLAIARSVIREPRILILDDSFSNVDTATEELILSDLKEDTREITTIIVSHRISTIKDSDIIIVIDDGKIESIGNHSELMKKSSIYQKLYYRQLLSEELKEEL